jgi:hypothetical protein
MMKSRPRRLCWQSGNTRVRWGTKQPLALQPVPGSGSSPLSHLPERAITPWLRSVRSRSSSFSPSLMPPGSLLRDNGPLALMGLEAALEVDPPGAEADATAALAQRTGRARPAGARRAAAGLAGRCAGARRARHRRRARSPGGRRGITSTRSPYAFGSNTPHAIVCRLRPINARSSKRPRRRKAGTAAPAGGNRGTVALDAKSGIDGAFLARLEGAGAATDASNNGALTRRLPCFRRRAG